MLLLDRKVGETIKIGDDIEVTILEVDRGIVRIGFTAPRDIKILRSEFLEKPKNEKK